MQTNQAISKSYNKILVVSFVIVLALGSAVFLVGCSSDNEPEQSTPKQSEEVIIQPVEHNIDIDPSPLSQTDETLTLEGYGAVGALSDKELSVTDMLMYAVQDEYLARGEYLAIIEKFGNQKPYANIVEAEETHLSFLREVYLAYELEFPEDSSAAHIIIPDDLLEAAKTGVQAEIDNIAMYEKFLSYDLPENVIEVFSALKSGSDSHLLAFEKQVDRLSD
jgi:hypothetical protein